MKTTPQAQEAIASLMIESGCGGAAIQGDAPVLVTCYFPVDDRLEAMLSRLEAGIKDLAKYGVDVGEGEIAIRYAEEQDWAEAWKQFFHTTRVGRRIVIKPSWEDYTPETGDLVVELDPGMAFGTGSHQTTQMCLQALEKYLRRRQVVVDFGTGSGILAIAAAKLGASLVIAFDAEETAVRAARANVQRNDLEEKIEVHRAESLKFISTPVDLVLANLVAETIIAQAEAIAGILRQGGTLIASGITSGKVLEVEQSLRNAGFDIAERLMQDDWAALVARKSR